MKKSIFLFFAAILCAMNVSAGDGFYSIYIKYYQNGQSKTSDGEWTSPLNIGTLTTDFKITDVYLKVWWADWTPSPVSGQLHYWKDGAEVWPGLLEKVKSTGGNNREIYAEKWNYVLASPTEASGKHEITYKWEAYLGPVTHTLPANGTKKITYTVLPPNPSTILCKSNGDGLGTETSPFLVPLGKTLTISVDGEQAHADGNSVLYAKFADAYTATLSHDITPTKSKQSITISAKYHNATDNLSSSNEKTITVYYQAVEEENHDILVSYKCGETILQEESTVEKVGVSTETPVTAPTIAGYTFSSWTLGAGVQSADATTNPISITTKSGETDYTLVANYTEDLTTSWGLIGSFVDDFKTAYDFVKKSGESTSKVAYVSIDLKSHKEYQFKVVEGETWYGNNNSDEQWWIKQTSENWDFYDDAVNCHMKTGLAGTYTFKIDYSGANPKVSVYFPEIYAIVGSFNEWNENANKLTFNGNIGTATINLEASATNYEFKVIDNAVYGGIVNKTITQTENDLAITVGGGDNIKLTANANPKGNYIFTYDKSTKKLSVTYPTVYTITVEAENGTVEGAGTYVEGTSVELTAKANEGYKFVNWTKGEVEVSTANPYEFTATEDVELVANFKATTITLTTGNNDAVIAANIGNTVDVVIQRSFTANVGYYTLCVPFNMDPSVIGKAYYLGDDIKKHVSGEGIDIELVEEKDMLSAGVPYLVLPEANMRELVVEKVTIQPDGASGKNVGNPALNINIFFEGFYSAPAAPDNQTNGTTQYYVGNNGYLYNDVVEKRGLCGLFTITDNEGNPAKVRARVVTREDAATGFENITNGENTAIKVIENGQLIIIRNGEKFNAQGQKI